MSKELMRQEKASKPTTSVNRKTRVSYSAAFIQKEEIWTCGKGTRSVAECGIHLLHDIEVYIYLLIRTNLVAEDKILRTHQEIGIFLV